MEKLPVENTAQKVGLKNKLAFASGDIFGGGSFNIINFLFVPFLTLTVGIPMYWVSVIMLISKVWDGIIDPFIGKISDGKQPGRFGKRRFFMLVCAPILIVATILLFFPWNLVTTSVPLKIVLVILVYLIYATTQSFILIPYYSLGSEMSGDFIERTKVNSVRLGFSIFSSIVCVAVPGMIAAPEKGAQSYIVMAAIFGGIFCIAGLITALFAREQIVTPAVKTKVNIKEFFRPLKLKSYRQYLGMQMCSSMGMAIMSSFFFTLMDFWIRRGSYAANLQFGVPRFPIATVAAAIMFVAQIFALPFYFWLIKRKSKTFAYRLGAIVWAVTAFALFFLPAQSYTLDASGALEIVSQVPDWVICMLAFVIGIGIGGPVLVPHTAFGDVCDVGELYFNERTEGAFSGLSNFLNTTAQAVGLAIPPIIIGAAGYLETVYEAPADLSGYFVKPYDNGTAYMPVAQSDSAMLAVRIVIAFLPIVVMAIGFFISLRYKVTREKQNEIAETLKLDKNSEEYKSKREEILKSL